MSQASGESSMEVPQEVAPPTPPPETSEMQTERFPKLKGKSRLFKGLHRIGSSNSITRLRSSSSSGYRGVGKGSISCISLNSSNTSPYDNSWAVPFASPTSNGYSTAPTSVPGTPGVDSIRIRVASGSRTGYSTPIPSDVKTRSRSGTGLSAAPTIEEDYFSVPMVESKPKPVREDFDFWGDIPTELRVQILQHLKPKQIVQCSRVSKAWFSMCFDGQLWASLDAAEFYRDIPPEALTKIITSAGPFVRDLNLRGCVQLWDQWRATGLLDACTNLEYLSLEGCRIDRNSIHSLHYQNPRLVHINLCGLPGVTNSSLKIISQYCSRIQYLNISWCNNVDSRGLRRIAESCTKLKDLRVSEVRGVDDSEMLQSLFKHNTLERLILCNCETLTDEALTILVEGVEAEVDFLTGRRIVPPRRLRHLDISRCRNITDAGLRALTHNLPCLEGLQLSKCTQLTDSSLRLLLPTLVSLTHLDIEELEQVTNATLQELAKSPCTALLRHLSISYCENLGDTGMLPIIKACPNLTNLDLDNTRISDLVLSEAAAMVSRRNSPPHEVLKQGITFAMPSRPKIGLRMVVYDCQNVTWNGIRDVLSKNAEIRRPLQQSYPLIPLSNAPAHTQSSHVSSSEHSTIPDADHHSTRPSNSGLPSAAASTSALPHFTPPASHPSRAPRLQSQLQSHPQSTRPHQVIALKVFYGYQPTVTEHTRRVLRGDFSAAARLERKWADYMLATDEASGRRGGMGGALGGIGAGLGLVGMGIAGYQARRRRRRLREAQMMHADEEDGGMASDLGGPAPSVGGVGRRRRARSGGGCVLM